MGFSARAWMPMTVGWAMARKVFRRKWVRGGGLLLLVYFGSYTAMSLRGHFEPFVFGLYEGPDGEPILAPKSSQFSYLWHPFVLFDEEGNHTNLMLFYLPLVVLDQKLVHRSELVDTGQYPVKDYFDRETREYRNVNYSE